MRFFNIFKKFSFEQVNRIDTNHFLSKFFQCNGIGQWFAATLQSERNINITNGKSLTVNGTNTNTPIIWINACQLWNISGHFTIGVTLALPINIFNVFGKVRKVRHNELMAECFRYEHNIRSNDTEKREPTRENVYKLMLMGKITITYDLNVSRFNFCVSGVPPSLFVKRCTFRKLSIISLIRKSCILIPEVRNAYS